jgi:magnesium transporter
MTALLFERNPVAEVEWADELPRIGRSAILWIDLEDPSEAELRNLVDVFDLADDAADGIGDGKGKPYLADHGNHLHVRAIGLSDARERKLVAVDCLVADRWLVTLRNGPAEVVGRFRDRAEGSGDLGGVGGLGSLANLLEWALTSYLEAFELLEADLEEIDTEAMSGQVSSVEHREVVLALTRPELEAISSSDSAERFASLRERLEDAIQASRDTRESIVGSFDVLQASTTRRMNEIMKVLTLASVLLLPGALIAGIMGMNFEVGLFDTAAYFWAVIALIVAVAVTTLVVARAREWI